jgi:hypothetical protein
VSDLVLKDVANAVGWLDAFGSDRIQFDSSEIVEGEDDNVSVHVEGYYYPDKGTHDHVVAPKHYIEATFVLAEASHSPVWEEDDLVDDEDDEEEDGDT